jgi:hypothetical protein
VPAQVDRFGDEPGLCCSVLGNAWKVLRCAECGREAETEVEAQGWLPDLTTHEEGADEATAAVAVYCPECAEREFGEASDFVSHR